MAGIVLNGCAINEVHLNEATNRISYRGPDGGGVKVLYNGTVGLGHRRLSIIDLSESGAQPMSNENGTIWITFNGEIYNYKSLREILIAKGHRFKSHSDTEVLIHGYEEWGTGLLEKIAGMFAFAIWDENQKHLFMARDRLGIKPLFYYHDDQTFIFGSELKSFYPFPQFKRDISYNSVIDYLNFSTIPAPATIWNRTFKVKPGHYIIYRPNEKVSQQSYWTLTPSNRVIDEEQATGEVNQMLKNTVQSHLESDVPVGLFLSSGYDSTALLAYMKAHNLDVNTFSIGFEKSQKTEHREAGWIASHFETTHHELILGEEFLSITEEMFDYYDEPYSVSSMISFHYLSQMAAKHNKVVFAGDGGDEVFGGYRWYKYIDRDFSDRNVWSRIFRSSTQDLRTFYKTHYMKYMCMDANWVKNLISEDANSHYPEDPLAIFDLSDDFWHLHPVKVFQLLDYKFFVPDVALPRSDRSGMINSLEIRIPFLDHKLVEYTMQLDTHVYYKAGIKKFLLHENIKSRLPNQILELPKRGFGNPLEYFDRNRSIIISDLVSSRLLSASGLFKRLDLASYSKEQLWLLYCLKCWYEKWAH
ncbi:MAG: asparagine synthase (glutamine-hydrolyzing) [Cyclobacteriaceae bacterium]|nr:asparagine synthase (glutamine-hydrolyzing) [Cyclobacteriaceae bacterium]